MTEFDFEELDKAVSDLMKDAGSPDVDTAIQPSQAVATATAMPPPSAPSAPAPQSAAQSLAVKRRGKFMDFMPASQAAGGRPLASHSPIKVEAPVQGDDTAEPSSGAVEDSASSSNIDDGTYAANPTPVNEWPDPIDVMEAKEHEAEQEQSLGDDVGASFDNESDTLDSESAHESAEPSEPESSDMPEATGGEAESIEVPIVEEPDGPKSVESPVETLDTVIEPEFLPQEPAQTEGGDVPQDVVSEVTELSAEAAMESPFLPDAKVEKRPLGVFAPGDELVGEQPEAVTPQADKPELPREFSSELMGLESDSSPALVEDQAAPEAPAAPAEAEPAPQAQQPELKPQYTEQPPSEVKTSGAIYDTDTYHQPIATKASKKHGWVVYVIWILSLLIVGACAGALYFYLSTR